MESYPTQARVVIVGGGIMGCGLAYHLARAGWSDIVLLEKGELTSGSTWHAAGQVTYCNGHYTLAKCAKYNIELYERLERETGQSATWHGCGSLRMAYNADEEDYLRHILSVTNALNLPAEILSPKQIAEVHPFYNLDGIRAAIHTPVDGHVDPSGAANALAKGARLAGATIIRKCRVTNINQNNGGEWTVETAQGNIACEHVVNAGGTYARQMALWNDYDLPAVNMTHHYFVTGPVAEFESLEKELPVVRDDRKVSGYMRMEQKSGLIGIYEKAEPNTVWLDGTPWAAEHELFEPHYERVGQWLESALERMPVLSAAGIRRVVHGAISHPPDGNPLIGPAPNLRNYWCCCGCQIGLGWGPALTRALAEWIMHGAANISMRDFDPRRFAGGYADRDFQIARGKEDYILRHETPFPHFSREVARQARVSPLYEILKSRGAVYEEISGWERPRWFARDGVAAKNIYAFHRTALHDIVGAEVLAVRENAGIMDISAFSKIMVSGAAAYDFLDSILPNRLPKNGRVSLAHALSIGGRLETEMTIARLSDDCFYLVCAAFFESRLLDYLNFAAAAFDNDAKDITIKNMSSDWGALALNGPRAREILSPHSDALFDNDSFPWLSVKNITLAGQSILAVRMSYCGELGWELHGDSAAIIAAYQALRKTGDDKGLVDFGSFAMNSLRMEKAFVGAAELTNEVTMKDAGLERFIAADKIKNDSANTPPQWRCAYLEIDGDNKNDGNGGEAVFIDGHAVGTISSIAYGHSVRKLLAFAYMRPNGADIENGKIEVMIAGEKRQAKILSEPVYDPKNNLPRS